MIPGINFVPPLRYLPKEIRLEWPQILSFCGYTRTKY